MASDVSSTEVNDVLDDEKEEGEISLDDVSSSEEGQPYKYSHKAFGQCPRCRSTKRCHPWCKTLIIKKPHSKRDAGLQGKENRKKQRHPKDSSDLSHVGSSSSSTLQEKNDDELALALSLTPISSDSDMELVGLQKARRRKKAVKKKRRKKSPVVFAGLTVEDLALTINRSLHKLNVSEALDIPKKESNHSGSGHSKHHHHHSKKLATHKSSPPPRRRRSPSFIMSPSPTPIRKRPRSPVPIKSSSSAYQRLKTVVKKSSPKAQLNISKESPETPSRGSVTKLLKKVKRLDPYPNKEKERVSLKDKLSNFIKKIDNKDEKKDKTEKSKKLEMENKNEKKKKKIEKKEIEKNKTIIIEGAEHIENCESLEVIIKKEIEIEEKKDVELDKKESKDMEKPIKCLKASPEVKEETVTRKSIEKIETSHHHHSPGKAEILIQEQNKVNEEKLIVLPEVDSETKQENDGALNVEDVKVEPIETIEPIDEIDEPPESQKLPNFCLDDNDEDMELRITALRSAMLKKHRTRVQSGKILKKKSQQQEQNLVPVPQMESPFPSNFEDQFPLLAEVCRPGSIEPNQDIYCPEDMELDSDMENDAISEMCSPYSLADNDASMVDGEVNMHQSLYSPSHPTGTPVSKPLAKRQQQQDNDISFLETVNQESSRPYSPSDATIYDPELPGVLSAEAATAAVAPLHPPPMPPLSMFDPSQQMVLGCSPRLLVPFVKPVPMVPPPMIPPPMNSFTAIHQSVNPMLMQAPAAPMFAYPAQPEPVAPPAPSKPLMNSSIDLETDIDGSPLVSIEKDTSSTWSLLNEPLYLQGVPNVAQGTVPTIVERSLVPAAVLKSNKHLQKQIVQKKIAQRESLFRHAEMRPVNSQLTSCSSTHFKPIKLSPVIKNSVVANPAPAFNIFNEDAEVNTTMDTSAETSTETLTKASTETSIEESPKKDSWVVPLPTIGRKRRMRSRNRRRAARERKRVAEESSSFEKAKENVNKEKPSINQIERRESLDEDEEMLRQHLLASLSKRNKEQVAKAEATVNEAKNTVASVEDVQKAEKPTLEICEDQQNVDIQPGEQQSDLEPLSIRTSTSKPNIAPNSMKRSSASTLTAGQPLKKIPRKSNEIQASKVVNNAKRYQNSKSQQKLTQQKISLLVASKARTKVDSDTPRSPSPQLTESISDSEKFIISVNKDSESDSETEGITVSPMKNRPTLAIPWSDFEKTLDQFLKSARQQHEIAVSTVEDPQNTSAVTQVESEQKILTPTTFTEIPDKECLTTDSNVKDDEVSTIVPTAITNVETGTTVTAVTTTPATTLSPLAKVFIPSSVVEATKTVNVIEAMNSASVTTTITEGVNILKTVNVVETVTTGSISTAADVKTVDTVSTVKTLSTTPATTIEATMKTIATPSTSTGTIIRTIKNVSTPAEIVKTVAIPNTYTPTIVKTIKNISTTGTAVTTKVAFSTAVANSVKEKITFSTPKPVVVEREMLSMLATPQAVKHLPASQQEEYRRLKQQIYEREKRLLKAKEARLATTSTPVPTEPASNNIRAPTSSAPALATSTPMNKNLKPPVFTAVPTPRTLDFSKSPVPKSQLVATISPMSKQSQIKKMAIVQFHKMKHSSPISAQGVGKAAQSIPISIQNLPHQKSLVRINSSTQPQTTPSLNKQVELLNKMTATLNDQQRQISAGTQKMQSSLRILTKDQINLKTSQIQKSMISNGKKVVMDDLNISEIRGKARAAENAKLRTPSVIEKSVNSNAQFTGNSMAGSKKMTKNSEISRSQTWAEFKQMVDIEVQTLLNLPPEEQTLLLKNTEDNLITKRHSVLEDIVAMSGSLSEWEVERDLQNVLSIEVNRLREELKVAEEKLQQQKDKLNTIQPQVSTYHEKINTGRKECFRFSKICGGLGKQVIGSDYKIPNESAELFNSKIKEIASHTQRLKSKNSISKESLTNSSLARTDTTKNSPKSMKNSSLNNEINNLSSNVNIISAGASSNKPTVNNNNSDNSETRKYNTETATLNDEPIRNNINVIVKHEPSVDVHELSFEKVNVKIEREETADRNRFTEINERVQFDSSYVIPKREKVVHEVIEESRIMDICTLLQNIETDIKRQFTSHSEMSLMSHSDCERENKMRRSSFNSEQATEMKMDLSLNNEDVSTEVYDRKPNINTIQSYNVGNLPMNNRVECPNLTIKNVDKSVLKNIKIEKSDSHQDKTLQTLTNNVNNDSLQGGKSIHLEDGKQLTEADCNNSIPNQQSNMNSENKIMAPEFGVQISNLHKTDESNNDSIQVSNRIKNNLIHLEHPSAVEVDLENVTEKNSMGFGNQLSMEVDIKKSFVKTDSASPPYTESIDVGVEFKSSLPTIVMCPNQKIQPTDSVVITGESSNKHIDPLAETADISAIENLLQNTESTFTALSSTKKNKNNPLFKVEKLEIDDLNDSDIEDYLFDSNFCNISEISNTEHSTLLDEIELLELASQMEVPDIVSQFTEKSVNTELSKQHQIKVKETLELSQQHLNHEIENLQQVPNHNKNSKLIQYDLYTTIESAQHHTEPIEDLKSLQQNSNIENVARFSKHNKIAESPCQNSKSVIEKLEQSKLETRSNKQLLHQTEKKEFPLGNFNRTKRKAVKPYESVLKHLNASRHSNTNGILCPFELSGICNDGSCQYIHHSTSHCS